MKFLGRISVYFRGPINIMVWTDLVICLFLSCNLRKLLSGYSSISQDSTVEEQDVVHLGNKLLAKFGGVDITPFTIFPASARNIYAGLDGFFDEMAKMLDNLAISEGRIYVIELAINLLEQLESVRPNLINLLCVLFLGRKTIIDELNVIKSCSHE